MKKTAEKNSSIKTLEKQIKNDEVYVHTAIAVMCGKGYKKMTVTKSAFKRNIMSLESSRYTLKRVAIPENAKGNLEEFAGKTLNVWFVKITQTQQVEFIYKAYK